MKTFSSSRWGYFKLGCLLLPSLALLVVPILKQNFYYPESDIFINPANGQPAPEMGKFLTPLISRSESLVSINLGDAPADIPKMQALLYLSPVIRMNPRAPVFKVTWSIHVANFFADMELTYDRAKGEVTETQTETLPGKSQQTELLGRYLTDRDIHQAAVFSEDYEIWARKHWSK